MPASAVPIVVDDPTWVIQGDPRLPLYQRLRDDLDARIRQGQWRMGEALPAEQSLASLYGVSLGTVRRAIDLLAQDGVVERRQGSGTYLRRADFSNSLFRFFRLTGSGGRPILPESRVLSRVEALMPPDVASRLGLPPGSPAVRLTRLRLDGDLPLMVDDIWLSAIRFAPLMAVPISALEPLLYPAFERLCQAAICSAVEELSVATADTAHANLLHIEAGAPVVTIERLACGRAGEPLEWRRSLGRADRFRYRVDIT